MSNPSLIIAALFLAINPVALGEKMAVDVEVDPTGKLANYADEDVDLKVDIVSAAGLVVATVDLVHTANRGDTRARYYGASFDLSAAGLNLPAGPYTIIARPKSSTWTETHPTTGVATNQSTSDVSHIVGRIVLEAAGAMTLQNWRF